MTAKQKHSHIFLFHPSSHRSSVFRLGRRRSSDNLSGGFPPSDTIRYVVSCCSRWFIKHPVMIQHSLTACEGVCSRVRVSPGDYLTLRSLTTTQTNICPEVIDKMTEWTSVGCVRVRGYTDVYVCLCVTRNMRPAPELKNNQAGWE